MTETRESPRLKVRGVFISDTHTGKPSCKANLLAEFLNFVETDHLVVNGDHVDGWYLTRKKRWAYRESHRRVLDAINAQAARGTEVTWVEGNHENILKKGAAFDFFRHNGPVTFSHPTAMNDRGEPLRWAISPVPETTYTDARGHHYVVRHGHQNDPVILKTKLGEVASKLGDHAYEWLLGLDSLLSDVYAYFSKKHFSLAAFLKHHVKERLSVIKAFEKAAVKSAQKAGIAGAINGHIHLADLREIKGAFYGNSGDWVEACTALVEDHAGNWRVVRWGEERADYGFTGHPTRHDPNLAAQFRPVTEYQLRQAHRLWPSEKDRKYHGTVRELLFLRDKFARSADPETRDYLVLARNLTREDVRKARRRQQEKEYDALKIAG